MITLNEVINQANENILILPSFQRGFKWKAENMRKLLESLVLNYPIGGVLLWETNTAIFEWRTLESVELNEAVDDDDEVQNYEGHIENIGNRFKYILDGQQRLTSIYKIFPNSINKTLYEQQSLKNQEIFRFFIDLKKLNFPEITKNNYLNYTVHFPTDIDIKADSCLVKNFQSIRKDYRNRFSGTLPDNLTDEQLKNLYKEQLILPLTTKFLTGDNTILNNWISEKAFILTNEFGGGYETNSRLNEIFQIWLSHFNESIQTILIQKSIPVISVPENTSWEGLSRIFETINSTGLSLTTFDLLVAKLSYWETDNNNSQNLRSLVKKILNPEDLSLFDDQKNLGGVACQQLPRIFALKAAIQENRSPSLKKSEILGLQRELLISVSAESCLNLQNALTILRTHLGIRNKNFLPFKDAITLSAFVSQEELNRFCAYYWFVLFSEKDLDKDSNSTTKRLYENWIKFKIKKSEELITEVTQTLEQSFPSFEEVLIISNSSSLLYRAFITYVYSKSTTDWAGINIKDDNTILEDHHIFPSRWLSTNINNLPLPRKNNVLNRVLVSRPANSNNHAGSNAPSIYLQNFQNLNEFLIPITYLEQIPYDDTTLDQKYRDRYTLLKKSIFETIIDFIGK